MEKAAVMRLGPALVVALLLLIPLVDAHVPNARPIGQVTQVLRIVDMRADGVTATVTLLKNGEPTRDWVRHTLDPARGSFTVEYRRDEASQDGRFTSAWGIERLVEYRDLNHDGRYQPDSDTVAKSYPLTAYSWRVATSVQRVQVGGVTAYDVSWAGTLSGSPSLRVEAVAAGNDFTDEGAFTRPQDVLLYLDVTDMPPRSVGSLFALELSFTAPLGTRAAPVHAGEYTTGVYASADGRHPMLIWGGEALLDGRESKIEATIGEPEGAGDNQTRRIYLHLPTVDRTMRFVMVDAIEYEVENKRAPLPALLPLVGSMLIAVWLRSGHRHDATTPRRDER